MSNLHNVIGFDLNSDRVNQLKAGLDINTELQKKDLINSNLTFTDKILDLQNCNVYIVAVPTPVNKKNLPDLNMLKMACRMAGKLIEPNNIVIFESTVYPGTTEEVCIPILEKKSKLKCKTDSNFKINSFGCGYSPERINPGDPKEKSMILLK